MNTFNRLAMIIILLGTIVAIVVGILLLLLTPAPLGLFFGNLATRLGLARGDTRLTELQIEITATALVVFIGAVVLLLLEVRRTTTDSIRISQVSGSEAHLSVQAVAQSLIYYIDALPGVVRVRPRLRAQGQMVDVRLDVETTPDVDVRSKTEEITRTARTVVEQRLSLKLRKLYIHLHHSSQARYTPLPAQPSPQPSPQPSNLEPLQPVKLEPLQPAKQSPAVQPARSGAAEPAPRGMLPEPPPVPASEATPHTLEGEKRNPLSG